jgi:formiminoglutamase
MTVLPILLSIPHGGSEIPAEVSDLVSASREELFDDGDPFTQEIYDLGTEVAWVFKADVARAVVDLNRAPHDRPPKNSDGVVKSHTCFGRPVYSNGSGPSERLTSVLLQCYYYPYHADLRAANSDRQVLLALDCHSMAATAPPVAPDAGESRPLFCLGTRDGVTCPPNLLAALREALAMAFECGMSDIRLDDPFKGGYITRTHGVGRVPWVQVEMNRSLYLDPQWFDRATLAVERARLAELHARFSNALFRLWS